MTPKDWQTILNPPPLFIATLKLEGDEELIEETTSGSSPEQALALLQPGWKVPITIVSLKPKTQNN